MALAFANRLPEKLGWDENSRYMLLSDIGRIHQRKKKEDNDDDVPLVYIRFHSWETAQSILKEIIHGNKNKKIAISKEQLYSKATQQKIDTANKIEENFKDCLEKKEWLASVKSPGIVMVKRPSETKYLVHAMAQ